MRSHAVEEPAINGLNHLGLLRHNLRQPIVSLAVPEEGTVGHHHLAIREAFPDTPGHVLGNRSAFLLRQAAHNGQHQLAFAIKGVDVLLLEVYFDAIVLQFPDRGQAVHGIPGEAAHRLGDDQVDLPGKRVRDHFIETLSVLRAGARDALVGIDLHEFPFIPGLNVFREIINLRFIYDKPSNVLTNIARPLIVCNLLERQVHA